MVGHQFGRYRILGIIGEGNGRSLPGPGRAPGPYCRVFRAEEELRRALLDDPACSFARGALAAVYFQQGRKESAPRELAQALEGREADALREMDPEVQRYAEVHVLSTVEPAAVYAVLGDRGRALGWLDRAVRNGDERSNYFRGYPMPASLREGIRFGQILSSIEFRRQG